MNEKKPNQEKIRQLLQNPPVSINLGLKGFADSLENQRIEVIHVQWKPPAGGDKEMVEILKGLF